MQAVYIESDDLAKRISRGQVKYIYKTQPFEEYTNHTIYVAGPKYIWGKIFLSSPVLTDEIPEEFKELYPGARRLYRFKVIVIQPMDPKPYTRKGKSAFFNITAPDDSSIENSELFHEIQDIHNYDPADQTKAQRADDWRLLIAHYAKHLTGKPTAWSKKDIERTALELARYMARHDNVVFHPDTMTHAGRELFFKLLEQDPELPHSLTDEELSIPYDVVRSMPTRDLYTLHSNLHHTWDQKHDEQVANLHDFVLDILKKRGKNPNCNTYLVRHEKERDEHGMKEEEQLDNEQNQLPFLILLENAVSLIGSQVYTISNDLIEPNDVDILLRYDLRVPALTQMLKDCFDQSLHIVVEPSGPIFDYVPLGHYAVGRIPNTKVISTPLPLSRLSELKTIPIRTDFITTDGENICVDGPKLSGIAVKLARITGKPVIFGKKCPTPLSDLFFIPHEVLSVHEIPDDYLPYTTAQREHILEDYRPGKPFKPLKVGTGYHVGETYTVDDAVNLSFSDEQIKSGIAVQPKADGVRLTIHKRGDKIWIFTEDKQRDRAQVLKPITEAARKLPVDSVILDTEVIEYENDKPIPRHQMVELIVSKSPPKRPVKVWVHDCIYYNGKDISKLPYTERLKHMRKAIDAIKPFYPMPTRIAHSKSELRKAIEWASAQHEMASEGAMLKVASSPYEGETSPNWAKYKRVSEIRVQVIGITKKPNPWPRKPKGELTGEEALRAYRQLTKDSRTYLVRGAIIGKDGKLVPIESAKKLAPGDLQLRWTGSKWTGLEDPHIWVMDKRFPHRKEGEYAYATTYAKAFDIPPKIGDLVTVRPMEMRIFTDEEGKEHVAWMFPILHEIDRDKTKPDTWADVLRIVSATKARHGRDSEPTNEAELSEGERVPLTRDESRALTRKKLGYDWYIIKQPPDKLVDFVLQYHVRGIIDKDSIPTCISELKEASTHTALARVWKRWGLVTLKAPKDEISRNLQKVDDARGDVSKELLKYISTDPPDSLPTIDQIYAHGNVHGDLRIAHPTRKYLIGWTNAVVKIALQPLSDPDNFFFPLRCRMLQNQNGDNWLANQKLTEPEVWARIVTPKHPYYWRRPGSVGATSYAGAVFIFAASGKAIYGVQKSDHYHEYFLRFDAFGPVADHPADKINGRWDYKYLEGQYPKTGKTPLYWQASRPWATQKPYILTHDYDEEAAKEKKAGRQWEWNAGTLKAYKLLFGKEPQ